MPAAGKNDSNALKHARTALSLMTVRGIDPTPINYTVWYHYATGARREMNRELDELLSKKNVVLTEDVSLYFYNKYIVAASEQQKANDSVSGNTQNVLAGIISLIDKVSGDTQSYSQQIDEQVGHLSNSITDPALKVMAKEIIARAMAIRDSSAALSGKLEDSRREVTELKTSLDKVTAETHIDFLTKVANRKALDAKLDEWSAWAKQTKGDICLLMIDIDHFKRFNDTYGHPVGDEVLRKVGRGILDCVKGKDFVARYGGEEFAVLLPETSLAGGLTVAENIRKTIHETQLMRKDTGTSLGSISISIGVAQFRPGADSVPLFISRADTALYRSKMGGRNRVTQESFDKE